MEKEMNPKEQAEAEKTGTIGETFSPKREPLEVEEEIDAEINL